MPKRKIGTRSLRTLLKDQRIRKTELENQTCYAAVDLVEALTGCANPQQAWNDLKHLEPSVRSRATQIELPGFGEPQDVLPLSGVMRLIQAIDSAKAARLRGWMADVAAQRVQEDDDPELAIQRMRQSYAAEDRPRQWIDQRLRCISARNQLVSEWYRRGVQDREQFRALTNRVMQAAFGMDVNSYRQDKGAGRNLRDHLTDLELSLLSLAEANTASLHRHRQSSGLEQLLRDIDDAGRIISHTRQQTARAMASGSNAPPDPHGAMAA